MKSSYLENVNFGDVIGSITFTLNPKKIVEFGILEGFSLQSFLDNRNQDCHIEAYDIFEDFNGNGACYHDITSKFGNVKNLTIAKKDFYQSFNSFDDHSIDILHVDIANNGDVLEFVLNCYVNKIRKGGIIIFEGGSVERDNVPWMKKYNKSNINPVIEKYKSKFNIKTFGTFPSLTIISL